MMLKLRVSVHSMPRIAYFLVLINIMKIVFLARMKIDIMRTYSVSHFERQKCTTNHEQPPEVEWNLKVKKIKFKFTKHYPHFYI